MGGSLRLGTYAGIGVFVHWTFALLIAYVAWAAWTVGAGWGGILAQIVFVLTIFLCVVLHEYGHALTARRYGIRTRDITLLPIGGVARLERMPEEPRQELWVALAGPAVNVVIATLLTLALFPLGGLFGPPVGEQIPGLFVTDLSFTGFLRQLVVINVFLVVFNMIPAFPMDGGRVLRAALAHRFDYARATRMAAAVGQTIAVGFAILALFAGHPVLLLIAVFVFMGAAAESRMVEQRVGFAGVPVAEAMITRFRALTENDTLADASEELLAGSQQDFPVISDGRIVGILPRNDLIRALARHGMSARVSDVMRRGCDPVPEDAPLDRVFARMRETDCPLIPVTRGDQLVGLLTIDNVSELLMLRAALGQRPPRGRPA